MSENTSFYDENELNEINKLSTILLTTAEQAEWQSMLQKAINHPDELLEDDKYSNYSALEDIFDEDQEEEDKLRLLFDIFCYANNIVIDIDWRGEEDDDQLSSFLAQRLNKMSPSFETHEVHARMNKYIEASELDNQQFDSSTDYFANKFSLLQKVMAEYNYKMGVLPVDYDSFPIFITSLEHAPLFEESSLIDFIPN